MKEKIKVLLPEAEVDKKIQELGEQISKDYEGKCIKGWCVLHMRIGQENQRTCIP